MKKSRAAISVCCAALAFAGFAAPRAFAQAAAGPKTGDFGIGIAAGQPSGATAKYWIDGVSAVDAGLGESNGNAAMYADLIWHAWDVLPQPKQGRLGLYFGAGPRLEFAADAEFAVRTFAGLSYWMGRHPVELFAEVGPAFQLTQGGDVYPDGAVGARFYFDWHGPRR
ncbi:MAG: hypothetical protein ACYCPQ_10695 [Elusimicrobiota bacterium]